MRVFTSSGRLANQIKINEIAEVGKLVKRTDECSENGTIGGVYQKVDECAAVAKYNVTPVDTKWVDTDKAFGEGAMHIRSRIVARVQKWRQARLVCGLEVLKIYHVLCCGSQSRVLTDIC